MTQRERLGVTAALALVCAALCALSWRLSATAGRVPMWVAGLTLIPLALQLRRDWRRPASAIARPREARMVLSMLALLGALYLLGFLAALPLFAAGQWRLQRPEAGWPGLIAIALAVFGILYLGFERLMGVELYRGAVWLWMAG